MIVLQQFLINTPWWVYLIFALGGHTLVKN